MPLAPPLFSITKDWPRRGANSFAVARMMTSVTLPAAIGTITRMGALRIGLRVQRRSPRVSARARCPPRSGCRRVDGSIASCVGFLERQALSPALFELIRDLLDAGLYAGFVLFAAGSAGDACCADHLVADLDGQRAAPGGEAGEILGTHLGILFQSFFHLARGDAESAGGVGLLEAVLHGMRSGTIATDLNQHLAVATDDRGRYPVAVRCAGGDGGLRDSQRHGR